jgi:hypothetical protein
MATRVRWWTSKWFVIITLLPLWPLSYWLLWISPAFSKKEKIFLFLVGTILAVWFITVSVQTSIDVYEKLNQYMNSGY